METGKDDLPIIPFPSQQDWQDWLETNHAESRGVWMKLAKKASGIPTVSISEAIDVAICFGWIDGQGRGHDDTWYLQRFTPRRPRSRWSEINVERVRRLTEEGRMRPTGLGEVDKAKADGRWDDAYPSPSAMEVPEDLRRAIEADPRAAAAFASIRSADRYSVLYRLHHTKTPETRARIIKEFVTDLSQSG
ncbi:MAG: YdeI/OmpD-associated family protein [Acidimicrobiia bacterium]